MTTTAGLLPQRSGNTMGFKAKFRWTKQPYAIRTPLGCIVLGPVDQVAYGAGNIVCNESELVLMTKRLDFLCNNAFNDGDGLRTAPSTEDRLAMKMAKETITLKGGHFEIGFPGEMLQSDCWIVA